MLLQKEILTQKLIELENDIKKLETYDSSYFKGKSHFEEDGTRNYLVFQQIYRYFKAFLLQSILNMFKNGNLKDYLVKFLWRFLLLIIVLIQH